MQTAIEPLDMLIPHRIPLRKLFPSSSLMGSKPFFKIAPFAIRSTPALSSRNHIQELLFRHPCTKPVSKIRLFCLRASGFSSIANVNNHTPGGSQLYLDSPEKDSHVSATLGILRKKMDDIGINVNLCQPGQHNKLICPECKGGGSVEKSLSVSISPDGSSVTWNCFRGKCGWKGSTRAFPDSKSSYVRVNQTPKAGKTRVITEESLELEPLSNRLVEYFAERMISRETLRRNNVKQAMRGGQIIAFPYRRNGKLVSCKYRDITKKFWQEKDTEKIFFGLDDIKDATEIIIVEGEIDKLAMEEAGFRNCVSVPDGAPPKFSDKDVPSHDKDTKYQYLWNCREYLEKASRITLATDGDKPGQALAEELARRLGRERCWRVKWPKKNDTEHLKDANEVLMHMGPKSLKEVIEKAELYPIKGLFTFGDFSHELDSYYHQTCGHVQGASTGWKGLNDLYNVVPGELTIVTGIPNSGKSEWIDVLLCNLNESHGNGFSGEEFVEYY